MTFLCNSLQLTLLRFVLVILEMQLILANNSLTWCSIITNHY